MVTENGLCISYTYVHAYVRTVKQSSAFNCSMKADSTLLHNHAHMNRHAYINLHCQSAHNFSNGKMS